MDDIKGIRTLTLNTGSEAEMRQKIRHYFHQTFTIDEKLYETLNMDAAFYRRADPLRHPIIFYLGHTATFYINKLNIGKIVTQRLNPAFESMFAVGVDEMSWDDLNAANYTWPAVAEVKAYRQAVRDFVDNLISTLPLEMPITWNSPWWGILMGIEHARIHLETSSVLIRQLPLDMVQALPMWSICPDSGAAPVNQLLPVKGGKLRLGKDKTNPLYGWDNEYGYAEAIVPDFFASQYLVSNQEYLPFVLAGGYQNKQWWTEEGWNWNTYRQLGMPLFWQKDEQGNYLLRTMASLIPMPWNWPVEVNYLEAKAFSNWLSAQTGKQLRLPTEEEWYILRDSVLDTDQPYWNKAPGNINLEYWASPCPVDRFALGDFYDVIGNVWQWTETPIYGFDGFDVHPYYDDFSTPTFDTRHNLIKGGSWISTGNEAIRDSRYAFRRHFYQHAGFRYVDSPAEVKIHEELYETEADVVPWCEEQWTIHPTLGESFSRRLVNHLTPFLVNRAFKSALILGCKTGRLAFELARYCDQVTATDFTARHINVCCDMREKGRIRFVIPSEGEIVTYREAHLEQFGLADLVNKVDFWQADASNLIAKFTGYDLIVAEHLLAETYNPGKFLSMINERLNPDGLLIIADSYPWKQSDLDKSLWVGGIRKDGEPYATLEGLKDLLAPHFDQVAEPMDLPLYLKQDNRNYQLSLCEVTIWKKR